MKKWTNAEIVELNVSETGHWWWFIGRIPTHECPFKKEEEKKEETVDLKS